ncbi:MAG: Gfo/Idh/MocA family oxidoreductase [Bifidobacteriaceae bacterium]|jgi:predicted dehydrogenase|nr:Gfo/Idh/MocA family oxidoreductase [Bifidobacteriaceae bacterium]
MADDAPTQDPIRYVLVGTGWRSTYFLRPPGLFPDRLRLTAVVSRTDSRGAAVAAQWSVPHATTTLAAAVKHERPDFVVVAVPREHAHATMREALDLGLPVLCETPPAPDLPGLHKVWGDIGGSGLVQVAEQYFLYPGHQARRRVIDQGWIGQVSTAQFSSTHGYHAVSILRTMLGVGFEETVVTAHQSHGPLADPRLIPGWSGDDTPKDAFNVLAYLAFSSGRAGLYDFSANQWWNPLRSDRIVVRGSRGEIVDDTVISLVDPLTVTTARIERHQTGLGLNLEGFDLQHLSLGREVLYHNAWSGGRLADDEIAVSDLLEKTGLWARGQGPQPYPLAQGCQDHAIALAINESAATGATPVTVGEQPWW